MPMMLTNGDSPPKLCGFSFRSKQYGEYRLSAISYSEESIKNREYLTEFEAKLKSLEIPSKGLERSISEQICSKKSRYTVPLSSVEL